jgi:signal transduction histidine kinase
MAILRPDGIVDAVEGGAPSTWIGHRLTDVPDLDEHIRNAAGDLVDRRTAIDGYVRRARVHGADHEVDLLVVEAIPVRRAYTRVDELILRTLDVFGAQAHSREIELKVKIAPDVPRALALDGEKLSWAVATLVGNALRFAEQRSRDGTPPHVEVLAGWDPEPNELVIEVADNGPGMSPARARWLFESDPATGRSAGLALLMVRDVVVAHHGTIAVESVEGKGTRFTLRIPR